MKDALETALARAMVGDEFICTRRSFSAIKERFFVFLKAHPVHVFRNRREGSLMYIWRSR